MHYIFPLLIIYQKKNKLMGINRKTYTQTKKGKNNKSEFYLQHSSTV